MVALFFILYNIPGLMDSIISVGEVSSDVSDLENKILQTDISIDTLSALVGSNTVTFNLNNDGSQKLWNYDEFEIFITYDADIGGVRTPVTEHSKFGSPNDFKIQRGSFIISDTLTTGTITEGIDFELCESDCFIKHVSTKNTGMGDTSGGGTQDFDDFETYVSDDSGLTTEGGTITFERNGPNNPQRVTWEIWEYVGDAGGPNEMIVWDTGVCTFGGASATCDGAAIPSFTGSDGDVVVFLTGHGNPNTDEFFGPRCWVTSEWVGGASDLPRFTRGQTGNACDVSYAVIEFSGSNWNVERAEYEFGGAATQTDNIADVGDISRAFFHTQQRNVDSGNQDGLCQSGSEVELTDSTTITYRLPQTTSGWGADMDAVTWVISNSDTTKGASMIVEHLNPPEHPTGGSEEDNWQVTITPLTYGLSATALTGVSTQSDGCGNAFPRSYISGQITALNTVDFWQSDSGQPQEYSFQTTQFPRPSPSQWKIFNILNDIIDPDILNSDETAQIRASLTYPIFSNGNLAVVVSTDQGITTSNALLVS